MPGHAAEGTCTICHITSFLDVLPQLNQQQAHFTFFESWCHQEGLRSSTDHRGGHPTTSVLTVEDPDPTKSVWARCDPYVGICVMPGGAGSKKAPPITEVAR
jgi:hypothetical protein